MAVTHCPGTDTRSHADRGIRRWALLAVLLNLALLLYFAATATVWDDEARAFYMANHPLTTLLGLMSRNVVEDPPGYFLLLHVWLPMAGFNPLLLRMTGFVFWVIALFGLFLTARRLSGERAGWYVLLVTAVMPHHWLLPATIRWFSLFACLAVLNFYSFLVMMQEREQEQGGASLSSSRRGWAAVGYVLTGTVMWYTNYIAPVYFLAHLVICLAWLPQRWTLVRWLAGCWAMISLLYLPWLPVLFRQLHISVAPARFRLSLVVQTVWELASGSFTTPYAWWVSVPLAIACLLAVGLMFLQFRQARFPLMIATVVMAALLVTRCLMPLRMTLISPFLALALGLSLAASPERSLLTWRRLRLAFVALAVVAFVGTAVNVVRQQDWASYRAIDPLAEAVETVRREHPEALVVTNSIPVLFYLGDELGEFAAEGELGLAPQTFHPRAIMFPWKEWRYAAEEEAFARCASVAYIHHASYGVFSSAMKELSERLAYHGLHPVSSQGMLQMPTHYTRVHPKLKYGGQSPHDDKRVTISYFIREKNTSGAVGGADSIQNQAIAAK